jgi:type I restriction enzyme, R subunit
MTRGIKYEDLPEHEKAMYEETFRDETGQFPKEIDSTALNNWLFNENTVDKVLDYLMCNGIKTEGGDKIGKSIIFAKSHLHAEFIEQRFNKMYPQYSNKLLRIIDNYEKYAQDLLDDFSIKEKYPQIAVSVDMLDTGVDVPEIVNLVIFKPVYSRAKFWQMLGRGTRTCLDLFAPGKHKREFNVFDFCGNFDFFNANPNGRDTGTTESVTARIFKTSILLAEAFREEPYLDDYHQKVRAGYLEWACNLVKALNIESFRVRMNLQYVEKFKHFPKWENLIEQDKFEIFKYISDLVFISEPDELAKRFDLLMLNFQLALAEKSPTQNRFENAVKETANSLSRLLNITDVARAKTLIQAARTDEFWREKSHDKLEQIRIAFRDLLKYIPNNETVIYHTDFEDTIVGVTQVNEAGGSYQRSESYIQKVEAYLRNNQTHFAIHKLRNNIPLNSSDLNELERMLFIDSHICTKEDFVKQYGPKPLGVFVRNVLGMDAEATSKAFSDFLDQGNLNSAQIQFVRTIIAHFKNNGILELPRLAEPPFTEINDHGLFGLFADEDQNRLIRIIESVNGNAVA